MAKLRFVQGPMPERIPGLNNVVQSVRVVYETDPAVARAMLPKPLVPAERPEVFLQFANVEMHVSAGNVIKVGALTCAIMCKSAAYCMTFQPFAVSISCERWLSTAFNTLPLTLKVME